MEDVFQVSGTKEGDGFSRGDIHHIRDRTGAGAGATLDTVLNFFAAGDFFNLFPEGIPQFRFTLPNRFYQKFF
jgi:hypothetical protein